MQVHLAAAEFQRSAVVGKVDGVLTDHGIPEHEAAQHVHILHHAVFGQQIDHRAEEAVLLLPDAHIHIFIVGAKDGVGARLFHPDANRRPTDRSLARGSG